MSTRSREEGSKSILSVTLRPGKVFQETELLESQDLLLHHQKELVRQSEEVSTSWMKKFFQLMKNLTLLQFWDQTDSRTVQEFKLSRKSKKWPDLFQEKLKTQLKEPMLWDLLPTKLSNSRKEKLCSQPQQLPETWELVRTQCLLRDQSTFPVETCVQAGKTITEKAVWEAIRWEEAPESHSRWLTNLKSSASDQMAFLWLAGKKNLSYSACLNSIESHKLT